MYCEKCGTKNEEKSKFCHSCGNRTDTSSNIVIPDTVIIESPEAGSTDTFYSKEWKQKNTFVIGSIPTLDILIHNDHLYLIKMPKYHGNSTGTLLGFLLGSILGAAIGASIGESNDAKKRDWYRSAWVNSNGQIISDAYKADIHLQIPLNSLKNNIKFGKNKVTMIINDKKVTLGRRVRSFQTTDRTERNRLNDKLKNYVL